MANITKQQLLQAIQQAPPGSNPRDLVDTLIQRGHIIEGLNDGSNSSYQQEQQQVQAKTTPYVEPEQKKTVGGFVGNVFKSAANTAVGLGKAVVNVFNTDSKKNTVANLGRVALGTAEKLIPGRQGAEDQADAVGRFFKERYGGWDNIKNTLYEDPTGAALDLASVLTAGGAAIKAAGLSGKVAELEAITNAAGAVSKVEKAAAIEAAIRDGQLGNVAKAGQAISSAGDAINPITQGIKATGKVMSKVAPKISVGADTFDAGTAATFDKYDINPTASMINDSPVVSQVEALAGKGILGGASKIGKQVSAVEAGIKDVGTKLAGEANLNTAGKATAAGFEGFVKAGKETSKGLYAAAEAEAVPVTVDQLQNTVKTLNDIISKQADSFSQNPGLLKEVQKIKEAITGGDSSLIQGSPEFMAKNADKLQTSVFTTKTLSNTIRTLYDKTAFGTEAVQTGAAGQLKRLVASMEEDLNGVMSAAPEKFAATRAATSYYREFISKADSAFGKSISKAAGTPSVIVKKIINNATPVEDIPKILSTVGEGATDQIRRAIIKDMIEGASSNAKVSESLTPAGLARKIDAFGEDKLKALLTPEQFETILDIKKLAQAAAKGSETMKGSQTAFLTKTGALLTGSITQPQLAIPALVVNVAFNKFVTSTFGQNILKSGIQLNGALGQAFYKVAAKYGKTAALLNAANRASQPKE